MVTRAGAAPLCASLLFWVSSPRAASVADDAAIWIHTPPLGPPEAADHLLAFYPQARTHPTAHRPRGTRARVQLPGGSASGTGPECANGPQHTRHRGATERRMRNPKPGVTPDRGEMGGRARGERLACPVRGPKRQSCESWVS